MPDESSGIGPWEMGAAWAVLGHIADRHAEQVSGARHAPEEDSGRGEDGSIEPQVIDPADNVFDGPRDWDGFIGQERAKTQLRVRMGSARSRGAHLDHFLLVAPQRGVGRATLAYLVAKTLERRLVRLEPPLNAPMVERAAAVSVDGDLLLLEDVDRLGPGDTTAWQTIRRLMGTTPTRGTGSTPTPAVTRTVVATALDPDLIPLSVRDLFSLTVTFEPYSAWDLSLIAAQMSGRYLANIGDDVLTAIGEHCGGSVSTARAMVLAGRDLAIHHGREVSVGELFSFLQVDPPRR